LLLGEISDLNTPNSRLRALIKQMAALYPASYGPYRSELSAAHHALATRLQKMAAKGPPNMVHLYLESLQQEIRALETLQIRVVDKQTSEGAKSKAAVLPISTDIVPYDSIGAGMICLMIAACFNCLDIKWRAERWIAAAIWMENARSGGGMAVFKIRFANILNIFDPNTQGYLSRIERSKYSF